MNLDDLVWHDGLLKSIALAMESKRTTLVLHVLLPEKLLSSTRIEYVIAIASPSRLTLNIDLDALQDNSGAGNISDAKVVGGVSPRLFLVLADGHVEAVGRSVTVTRLTS
jgi:hypothetical protein